MMVEEATTLEKDLILLIQSQNHDLEDLIPTSVKSQNIRCRFVEDFSDLMDKEMEGQIITFIVGSDVQDPVQSAQRLHSLEKDAKIILLRDSEKKKSILKEAIRFSPFIGMEVFCLDQSNESDLESLSGILQDSLQAVQYRSIIAATNSQIPYSVPAQLQSQKFNHQFINKLMDMAPIGIAIINRKGEILGWNKEATSIFNRNESQVLGNPLSQLFHPPERRKLDKYLQLGFQDQNSANNFDLNRKKDNTTRQFLNFKVSLFTHSEVPEPVLITVIKDITERKLAEKKLQKLNRSLKHKTKVLEASNAELEQFAFVASHDLQEPLRMITSFLSRLEEKYDSVLDEKGKKYIHLATDGAQRMRHIILDLLDFSRIGRINMERNKVDVNQVLQEVISLNKNIIKENRAKVKSECEMPVINAAEGPMHQLFQNLLNNAIKYQEKGKQPVVIISCKEDQEYWQFSVRDNGIGINPEYTDKIFNIFQRLHGNDEYSGTGMGLAICKKIVEEHGGKIWVESEEDEGSTFFFTLKKNGNHPSG
ncbi:PAS domain-containing protein [Rhodohalobacter sp. SW132]|uniref:sensor histidine kinase n=1 Tax=Rhodohalobacter sp. SW132 TaxID=2293433 RepID=UPI000E22F590|nr:ATP-binding protein [Rhodohalobacter sp. SW132]REL29131.1 PAS domain-containing protein [Rhodohalobacter sp. SW132]